MIDRSLATFSSVNYLGDRGLLIFWDRALFILQAFVRFAMLAGYWSCWLWPCWLQALLGSGLVGCGLQAKPTASKAHSLQGQHRLQGPQPSRPSIPQSTRPTARKTTACKACKCLNMQGSQPTRPAAYKARSLQGLRPAARKQCGLRRPRPTRPEPTRTAAREARKDHGHAWPRQRLIPGPRGLRPARTTACEDRGPRGPAAYKARSLQGL